MRDRSIMLFHLLAAFAGVWGFAAPLSADSAEDGTVVAFGELTDLGIPYEMEFREDRLLYARNAWTLFEFGDYLFIGAGNARNSGPAPNAGPFYAKGIHLPDDSVIEFNEVTEQELNVFRVIDGQLVAPGIDPSRGSDVDLFLFQERYLISYPVAEHRNHLYDVYRSRRNGRYFGATGYGGNVRDEVVSSSDRLKYDWRGDRSARTAGGARAVGFLEFGPPGEERLFVVQWSLAYDHVEVDDADNFGAWHNYEYNFETEEWEGVTNMIWSGLDRRFTDPATGPDPIGIEVALEPYFLPWRLTRIDEDTYMAVFGRMWSRAAPSNRFNYPGLAFGFDDGSGMPDNATGSAAGGVYRITLGSTPPNERARGGTFFECERVLDPGFGRQWDFQVVGDDVYVLTETPDLAIHVYRNGEEVLRVPDAPTFARSFAIVGESIYLGLGSEVSDPYRNNGQRLSPDCGRILKAEGVLGRKTAEE